MSRTKSNEKKHASEAVKQNDATDAAMDEGVDLKEFTRRALEYPNVWTAAPVSIVPEKWLNRWSIIKVLKVPAYHEEFGFHFVGRNVEECNGAVSSKIEQFDPVTMTGVTRSGRLYRLLGLPGSDPDAEYVLSNWLRRCQAEAVDATDEFIKQYGIPREHIESLAQAEGGRT